MDEIFLQLFPGMTFGLSTVNMTPKKTKAMMQSIYFKLLPLLGVNFHITKERRMLGERFHGLGLPNFVVLCFASKFFSWNVIIGAKMLRGDNDPHI